MSLLTILYEDSRGTAGSFPLHDLVRVCAEERLNLHPWELMKRLIPVPKRGIGKLLDAVREDLGDLTRAGPVIVVPDRDKIHEHLKLGAAACLIEIRDGIKTLTSSSHRLHVSVMDPNLEGLLRALRSLRPGDSSIPWDAAISGKDVSARDRVLQSAALDQKWQDTRARLAVAFPPFGYLVERVIVLLDGPA